MRSASVARKLGARLLWRWSSVLAFSGEGVPRWPSMARELRARLLWRGSYGRCFLFSGVAMMILTGPRVHGRDYLVDLIVASVLMKVTFKVFVLLGSVSCLEQW